jgi:hypothetical protein
VFERLRADWRRGRALKQLRLGERQYWEWDSKTSAGTLCGNLRFDAEGDVLVLTFYEIWPKESETAGITGRNAVPRADLGLTGARAFVEIVSGLAADLGYDRLRIRGQRTRLRRKKMQSVDFDLSRFQRSHRLGR